MQKKADPLKTNNEGMTPIDVADDAIVDMMQVLGPNKRTKLSASSAGTTGQPSSGSSSSSSNTGAAASAAATPPEQKTADDDFDDDTQKE